MIPNYKRPQINEYIFDILERPMTDEDLEMINYLQEIEKENKELKKQLEDEELWRIKIAKENSDNTKECFNLIEQKKKYKAQQKELIKYLEDEIRSCKAVSDLLFNSNKEMKVYKEILTKYKKIIGISDEK